ncbi:anti-repressor SinI family protein [Virgibacillus oceani]
MQNTVKQVTLDSEWVSLIQKAKTLGMTVEEIRAYLKEAGNEENA